MCLPAELALLGPLQRVLDIDPADAGVDQEKIQPGLRVKTGPPSHALEMGDEGTSCSDSMDESRDQHAGATYLLPKLCRVAESLVTLHDQETEGLLCCIYTVLSDNAAVLQSERCACMSASQAYNARDQEHLSPPNLWPADVQSLRGRRTLRALRVMAASASAWAAAARGAPPTAPTAFQKPRQLMVRACSEPP